MTAATLIRILAEAAVMDASLAEEEGRPTEFRALEDLAGALEDLGERFQAELRRLEVPLADPENLTALVS